MFSAIIGLIRLVLIVTSVGTFAFGAVNVPVFLDAKMDVDTYESLGFEERVAFDVALSLSPQANADLEAAKITVDESPATIGITFVIAIVLFIAQDMLRRYVRFADRQQQPTPVAPVVVMGAYPRQIVQHQAMPQPGNPQAAQMPTPDKRQPSVSIPNSDKAR